MGKKTKMKIRLRWVEEQIVIAEYEEFELSTDDYPELTECIYDLVNASPGDEQHAALSRLEYKMQEHKVDGVPIFDKIGPYEQDPVSQVVADVRDAGFIPADGMLADLVEDTKKAIDQENKKRGYYLV